MTTTDTTPHVENGQPQPIEVDLLEEWPFNFDDADLLLQARADDDAMAMKTRDFNVHRAMLSIHSDFFRTMFSLPQPASGMRGATSSSSRTVLPHQEEISRGGRTLTVLNLDDNWKPLYQLLKICYGETEERLQLTFTDVKRAIDLTLKYSFTVMERRLRQYLLDIWLETEPIKIYWFASLHRFDSDARKAARASLSFNPLTQGICEEMHRASAADYQKLLQYRHNCHSALQDLMKRNKEVGRWFMDPTVKPSMLIATGPFGMPLMLPNGKCSSHYFSIYLQNHEGGQVRHFCPSWAKAFLDGFLGDGKNLSLASRSTYSQEKFSHWIIKNIRLCGNCGDGMAEAAMDQLPEFVDSCVWPHIEKALDAVSINWSC